MLHSELLYVFALLLCRFLLPKEDSNNNSAYPFVNDGGQPDLEADEESLIVPERRSGLQADVSGVEEYQPEMDNADQELERSHEPVCDSLRRASADGRTQPKLTYTESCLGPVNSSASAARFQACVSLLEGRAL